MVAYQIPKRLTVSLTPVFAIAAGAAAALTCMLVPSALLEAIVLESGIPALLPAAAPPLGWTARTALAMIVGGGAAAAAWLAAYLVLGGDGAVAIRPRLPAWHWPRWQGPTLPKLATRLRPDRRPAPAATDAGADIPVLRRADAHPDAPARAPLRAARDLGMPFLDVKARPAPAERDLPRNLDAPLSAFDPLAIPAVPAEPIRAVAPLHSVPNPADPEAGERFEAFQLRPPIARPLSQPPIAAPRTDATIHALLDRLERGVSARAGATLPVGDLPSDVRRLATR